MNVNEARFIGHEQGKGDKMSEIVLKVIRPKGFVVLESGDFLGSICWSSEDYLWMFYPFTGVIIGDKAQAKVDNILAVLNQKER